MPRNKVYAIVEGHGEANVPGTGQQPAVTVLIARLLSRLQCGSLFPYPRPWRMRSCGDFFAEGKLENVIRAHKAFDDCIAVLVLVDLDDDCPGQEGPALADRVRDMEALPFSILVVCAHREYECWFLASLESIHPGYTYPDDPESRRDAKGWLAREFGYREVRDQSSYTRALDIDLAWTRSRSFRRLHKAFEELTAACLTGQPVITPR